jgi:hypothetical protein
VGNLAGTFGHLILRDGRYYHNDIPTARKVNGGGDSGAAARCRRAILATPDHPELDCSSMAASPLDREKPSFMIWRFISKKNGNLQGRQLFAGVRRG